VVGRVGWSLAGFAAGQTDASSSDGNHRRSLAEGDNANALRGFARAFLVVFEKVTVHPLKAFNHLKVSEVLAHFEVTTEDGASLTDFAKFLTEFKRGGREWRAFSRADWPSVLTAAMRRQHAVFQCWYRHSPSDLDP
jgi:hypothetical protein